MDYDKRADTKESSVLFNYWVYMKTRNVEINPKEVIALNHYEAAKEYLRILWTEDLKYFSLNNMDLRVHRRMEEWIYKVKPFIAYIVEEMTKNEPDPKDKGLLLLFAGKYSIGEQ